jgi:hypothetical protein
MAGGSYQTVQLTCRQAAQALAWSDSPFLYTAPALQAGRCRGQPTGVAHATHIIKEINKKQKQIAAAAAAAATQQLHMLKTAAMAAGIPPSQKPIQSDRDSSAAQTHQPAQALVLIPSNPAAEPQLDLATQEPAQLPLASAELLVLQPTAGQMPELRFPTAAQEPVQMFPLSAAEPQLNPYQQEPAQQPKTPSAQKPVLPPNTANPEPTAMIATDHTTGQQPQDQHIHENPLDHAHAQSTQTTTDSMQSLDFLCPATTCMLHAAETNEGFNLHISQPLIIGSDY